MITNIAGYHFIALTDLHTLRKQLLTICHQLFLRGTILLSPEGININLAGQARAIADFKEFLFDCLKFPPFSFHQTLSANIPFKKLKIKLKKEIITFRQPEVTVTHERAPQISAQTLKKWLDDEKDFILLDTRNLYEIEFGTFAKATHLSLSDFCHFPNESAKINLKKPIVMFCTGGIRCEKAALYLLEQEKNSQVYQLEGGILGYFAQVGGDHYQGNCFVFDERIAVNSELKEVG